MTRADTGLLLFVEDPERTVARWREPEPGPVAGRDLLEAAQNDMLEVLSRAKGTVVYVAPAGADDTPWADDLVRRSGAMPLDIPAGPTLQRWNSGLSILFNRCAHRKIICVDAGVPDLGLDDLSRARRKLDLYRVILGREGEGRCWLVGLNGYEEGLGLTEASPDDLLHPLLQAAGRAGLDVSLLDTKRSLAHGVDLETLRALARRDDHPRLAEVIRRHGLLVAPVQGRSED